MQKRLPTTERILKAIELGLLGVAGLGAAAAGGYVYNNLTYFSRDMAAVWRAGVNEKCVEIDGERINYAEGADHGPALLLIHGQSGDWQNYARTLPRLVKNFHVYAVDCFGHGGSSRPPEAYSVNTHGPFLAEFIDQVVNEPTIVSGHSSGGHLAAWLGANVADQVRAVVLEDPPLFTTPLPRARMTWNYVDLASNAHRFLGSGQRDFVAYQVEHARMWQFFGNGKDRFVDQGMSYRAGHPGDPVRWWSLPPIINESFRGLQHYDPRFGDAFYTGSWDDGFDHAETLAKIAVPTALIHTNWTYDDSGILMAAMDGDDADRACSLIADVAFAKVDSGHNFHWEKPADFVDVVAQTQQRLGG